MSHRLSLSLAFFLMVLFAAQTNATTWDDDEVTCPLCGTKNTFSAVMSYGGYIYNWPSKAEFVFWPYTDSKCLYSCRECRLTLFMQDFADVPESKRDALKPILKTISFSTTTGGYDDIPLLQRIDAAEKLYGVLDKDPEFWCLFYRVKGYHLAEAAQSDAAKLAREKTLGLAQQMLAEKRNAPIEKELLVISGAMKHLLGDDASAVQDFKQALKLKYRRIETISEEEIKKSLLEDGEKADPETIREEKEAFDEEAKENREGKDEYLTELAKEFLDALKYTGK